MESFLFWLIAASAGLWFGVLLLPWRPWSKRPFLDATDDIQPQPLQDITVLIPARNEAAVIRKTLESLKRQGKGTLKVVVVDDQSTDGTSETARDAAYADLVVVTGDPLPPGWSGKLWALEQGRQRVETPLVLLLDADIALEPGIVDTLRYKMSKEDLQFVSLMATPHMHGFWEKLLMPAFVYFFKLLYPFRLANSSFPEVAAAAGGCILLESRLLDEIGGFGALRDALIDDCTLAYRIKSRGYKTWIGLTHSVCSQRSCPRLSDIWNMVVRTAYTQLRYSHWLLGLCTMLMVLGFWLPVGGFFYPDALARSLALAALIAMMLSYMPMLQFYRRSPIWALGLPLIGTLFLAMTWSSALRYWRGRGAQWKDRRYSAPATFVLLLTLCAPLSPGVAEEHRPAEVVERFQQSLVEVMKKADVLGYEGRYEWLAPAVRQSHALPEIARLAVGRYWDRLGEEQKSSLVEAFSELSIATYAYRFDGYNGERFETLSVERLDSDQALVRSRLIKSGGDTIGFDYLLRGRGDDWRIVNIIVDGVSDLALKRAEYTSIIRRQGFETLIAKLKEKIAQYSTVGDSGNE